MTDKRAMVRALFMWRTRRPVRWADELTTLGDFDGRDCTLEVFDVPAEEEWELFRSLRTLRRRAAAELGRALTLIFHTPEETTRLYAWVRARAAEPVLLDVCGPGPRRLERPAVGRLRPSDARVAPARHRSRVA